jgi:hypothetical protein
MPAMGDVIGALATHIARGRSQGDLSTVEVARLYQEHPLLSTFPVPRVSIDEIVLDLKFAVNETPIPPKSVSGLVRERLIRETGALLAKAIREDVQVAALAQKSPVFASTLETVSAQTIARIEELIPEGVAIDPKSIGRSLASTARIQLAAVATPAEARLEERIVREFVAKGSAEIEARLGAAVEASLSKTLAGLPMDPSRLSIQLTAAELQSIPPDRIQTMRLTFKESDRSWTQVEDASGKPVDRLVPA